MTVEHPMTWLLLETSGRAGLVGLAHAGTLAVRPLQDGRRQARDLVPVTQALLTEQNLTPGDLTGVIVSLGPGSYTGLRVGLMSAKVLAHATGCCLIGVPTFAVLASQVPGAGLIEVLADAQKDRVYQQSFVSDGHAVRPVSELRIVPYDVWLAACPAGARLTGPGALKYPDRLPSGIELVASDLREATAPTLLRLGLVAWEQGRRDDPFTLEPLYLRPSSAEEQWAALGR